MTLRLPAVALASALLAACAARAVEPQVTITPIDQAFAANSMNHVAFRQNSLRTIGNQQFASYYDDNGLVTVARRTLGSTQWEIFNTAYTDNNSGLTDDHNVIAFGVDGDGYMHLSWGMHNHDLRYIKSDAPVTGTGAISFGQEIPMVDPQDEGLVTYPQFYDLPGGDLMFMYRTGGSGNGDTQINRYDTATATWQAVHRPLFDGQIFGDGLPSVNNYPNTLAFDSQGDIHFTWTVRDTPDFQTNKNIYYAKSTDEGLTWQKSDGTPYPLPFGEVHSELVVDIPEGSSLINQTSMTVDANDLPVVATWWAPGATEGNHTRQYMLAYNDGAEWKTSQITDRAWEPMQGASTVREMARPIVVVDDDNRVIVAMRFDERDDVVTIAHSTDRENWEFVDLAAEDMGTWEPNYDPVLWEQENKLALLYQPVGLGQNSSTISVLEWDAAAYFDALEGPRVSLRVDRFTGEAFLVNESSDAVTLSGYELASDDSALQPSGWFGLADQGAPGWGPQASGAAILGEGSVGGDLVLEPGDSIAIGSPYAESPTAFGDDDAADLTFRYQVDGEMVTGTVDLVGESANNLSVVVDPETGEAVLVNSSGFEVAIEGYTIVSPGGSLLPGSASWASLDDSGEGGGDWFEANPSANRLSELKESGALTLAAGDSYSLGRPFDPQGEGDLVFEFLLAGDADPTEGVVRYASLATVLAGDFNNDGVVDAADYVVWRNAKGSVTTLPNDRTPGYVSDSDFQDWRENYGLALPSATTPVPEPTAGALLLATLLAGAWRRGF